MGTYIHYTDEQKEQANSVDLEEFLRRRGEKLPGAGRSPAGQDPSYYCPGQRMKKDYIARRAATRSASSSTFTEQCTRGHGALAGKELGRYILPRSQKREAELPKPFRPAAAHDTDMRRVYATDKQRHISRGDQPLRPGRTVVRGRPVPQLRLCGQEDEQRPRHAHKRSTNSQGKSFKVNVEAAAGPSTASTTQAGTAWLYVS